jgi:hypothetical protein
VGIGSLIDASEVPMDLARRIFHMVDYWEVIETTRTLINRCQDLMELATLWEQMRMYERLADKQFMSGL